MKTLTREAFMADPKLAFSSDEPVQIVDGEGKPRLIVCRPTDVREAPEEKIARLERALKSAVEGLRMLRGMTGTVATRMARTDAAGYKVAGALGIPDPGYDPLARVWTMLTGEVSAVDSIDAAMAAGKEQR